MRIEGFLFDVYNFEDRIHLWILDSKGRLTHLADSYHPVIYAHGDPPLLKKLVRRLIELDALLEKPVFLTRKHFYKNEPVRVLQLTISRPSVLKKIRRKLYAFYRRMDIYHSDIEIPTGYMFARDIYPLAPVVAVTQNGRLQSIRTTQSITALEYDLPPLRIMRVRLRHGHRLGMCERNPLIVETQDASYNIAERSMITLLHRFNELLERTDPDIILSGYGDQIIFPTLFKLAQDNRLPLLLDRDRRPPTTRKIITKGSSYNTYGSWIYKAPGYPLFGRWHIDSANSFVYKETELRGIIELARISRIPVQKLARSSTGTALTSIETHVAIRNGYLVPWQKSSVESAKTLYELIRIDKGGLVFVPEAVGVYQNAAQIDYSQMYPGIMVNHNISPETVSCLCCEGEETPRVPEAGFRICIKRDGVVSQALRHILDRRKYYKKRIRETGGETRLRYDAMQNSLKWMLVTSFGYLGYRNAKFGRIESHESVTAFGREIFLTAKEIAEEQGFRVLHAITDCLFLTGPQVTEETLGRLCSTISRATGVDMDLDGIYSWLVFLPSKADPELPVVNRYFGRFSDASLKYRGIAARRKDMPAFVRSVQLKLLEIMQRADSITGLRSLHEEMHDCFHSHDHLLEGRQVPWSDLLLRKTASRALADYRVANATALSMAQLNDRGIEVQAGEKVRYVVLNQNHEDRTGRYLSEEAAVLHPDGLQYDVGFYRNLLWECYREVWQYFAPEGYFLRKPEAQLYLF